MLSESHVTDKAESRRGVLARLSLEHKLPLLIGGLLLGVIVALSVAAYAEMKRTSLQVAEARLASVTTQFRDILEQSSAQFRALTTAAAGQPAIERFSSASDSAGRARALGALRYMGPQPEQVMASELRDSVGHVLLSLAPSGAGFDTISVNDVIDVTRERTRDSAATGPFHLLRDTIVYPIVAPVRGASGMYLVFWRRLAGTRRVREQTNQLIGSDASLFLGDDAGKLWTDMERVVPAPPLDRAALTAPIQYDRPGGGGRYLISVAKFPRTPWLLAVEVPLRSVLAPVNAFLKTIALIASVALGLGLLAAWLASRRITGPLSQLTYAADAVASGNYDEKVPTGRSDELGRLGRAFAAMAGQVQLARTGLEREVGERTRDLNVALQQLHAAQETLVRQSEAKLRDSDERFRRVVESDMLGIMFWDAGGKIYDANDLFLRMVGHSRATLEAGSMSWTNMTPPEYLGLDKEMVATLEEHGVIAPYEKEYFTADGRRVEVLVGAATLKGGSEGGVSFVLDISERRAAERALRARARQQTAVARFGELTLVSDGLGSLFEDAVTLVADTLELPFSGVLERRADDTALLLRAGVGWSSSELGHTVVPISEDTQAGLTLLHNEPVVLADLAVDRRFQQSAVMRAANIASGITVVIPGSVRPFGVLTAHDRRPRQFTRDDVHFLQAIAHVLGTAIERSRTDTALRQTQRLEAVGRLASGVSHDFNNVLAAIVAYAEIVHSGLHERDPMREDVSEILKAAGRATALTRQLMAFSRQQVLRPSMVRLNDVIAGLENMLQRLVGREIQFSTVLDPEIGWIKTDPGQIEQVIVNLCVNARDAMPDGGRLIVETANVELDDAKARAYSMESPGSYVMLAVSDTGTGMDAETKARIFEPFFTTKESDKGTGLGLATVYGIVKQSGGESWVYSEIGHGTSFKIFLPRIDEQVSDDSVADDIALATGGTETILLAEDDDASFQIAMRLLEQEGYTVISARSGTEAARKADAYDGTIHLIVSDVVMRGMNGLQLAAHVRAQRSEARLLLVSGYTDAAVSQLGQMPEGARFLQKPFTPEALAREVRVALGAADGRAASTARA